MPEGDTVRRTAHRLDAALAGEMLTIADLRWPSLATTRLTGWTTTEVVARGKHLLHRFAEGATLHSHLRMEGQWRIEHPGPASDRLLRDRDLRAALGAPRWHAFGLRLGVLELVPTAREHDIVGHLGPDVLGGDWDPAAAAARLVEAGKRAPGLLLADALLDQRILCGIGTFWASEGLFLQRLHPWACLSDTDPEAARALLDRIHRLMARATETGWQSSTGSDRTGELAHVHGRSGRPCRRCGDTVRVAPSGTPPRHRTIFSCPTCQGGLAPTDDGRPQRPLGSSGGSRRRRT